LAAFSARQNNRGIKLQLSGRTHIREPQSNVYAYWLPPRLGEGIVLRRGGVYARRERADVLRQTNAERGESWRQRPFQCRRGIVFAPFEINTP
jgi:hypothetical protein